MPNYKRNDPKGWCGDPTRGAALGRSSIHEDGFAGKLTVRRVPIDRDGYDPNGTYFGYAEESPLFWCASEEGEVDYVLRAANRDAAIKLVRQSYPKAPIAVEVAADEFILAYLTAALWSSNDESDDSGGEPLDKNHTIDDIAQETREEMVGDCLSFWQDNRADLAAVHKHCDSSRAGHNFWLNRNGHGSGFWDEYYGDDVELKDAFGRLDKASKAFGDYNLYVGDDGKIHGE